MMKICMGVPCVSFLMILSPLALSDPMGKNLLSLELRNFYYNRDYRNDGAAQSKRDEWAQSFMLDFKSAYHPVGVLDLGVDAIGMLGIKLDSSPDRTGSGLLQFDSQRNVSDEYGKYIITGKARFRDTEVRLGGINPVMPLLASNNSRLFPQIFRGGLAVSRDASPMTLSALRVNAVKQRNSTDYEKLTVAGYKQAEADTYTYLAIDFAALGNIALSYHVADLEDVYRANFGGLKLEQSIGNDVFLADVRYFSASEVGRALVGEVENRTLSSLLSYRHLGHTFGLGYQHAWGQTPFAVINGADTYLFAESFVSTFTAPQERVFLARYEYNFAAAGIPGLNLVSKYAKGGRVDPTFLATSQAAALRSEGERGKEWERSTDITYTVQQGVFKDLSLQWRNATNRSTYADSANENRLMFRYVVHF